MFDRMLWQDNVRDPARTYKATQNADGTVTMPARRHRPGCRPHGHAPGRRGLHPGDHPLPHEQERPGYHDGRAQRGDAEAAR